MLFPHNSMFAGYVPEKKIYTYLLKINGTIVPVTNKLWWKKDFLETNAAMYGAYYEKGQQSFLEDFIKSKLKDTTSQHYWIHRLTSGNVNPQQWATFYINFAGSKLKSGDSVELTRYEIKFYGRPGLVDSFSIFNFRQP